ncbi:MAG: ADP-ribosyl-(dinitrogen reductase) hydrolase [Idiomarina sp.]
MLIISPRLKDKLQRKHHVTEEMVREAFANRSGGLLQDTREEHSTIPPTQWFIAETDDGIKLKICFVFESGKIYIKTAYRANKTEQRIYQKHG